MINPGTYESLASPLVLAAEDVVLDVGNELVKLNKIAIANPEAIIQASLPYTKKINTVLSVWNKKWKAWADNDLATAYLSGVQYTEQELGILRKAGVNIRKPTQNISNAVPLANSTDPLVVSASIGSTLKARFKDIPNHLTQFNVFRDAAYNSFEGTSLQVLRVTKDLYRDVAVKAGETMFRESDIFTRRAFSQAMLNEYAEKGLQSITYANGRKMSLDAYAEMSARTISGHSAVQASLNRYEEYGYDLVRVSAHFTSCQLCSPWEGRILSQSGKSDRYPSLNDAISGGLFHPNCAHDISPYFIGLSPKQEVNVDPNVQNLIDEKGRLKAQDITYKASQRQRQIEKNIRDWKRRETVTLDKTAGRKAHSKVLEWQKAQRQHLKDNPFLRRRYAREQIKRAH